MIDTVHIFIMGFTQSVARVTGIEQVWREVRRVSSDRCWVLPPLPWDFDAEEWAALIVRNTEPYTEINIHAYSYGGGWGFPRLARALRVLNRRVRRASLCDPVHRYSFVLFRPLSLTSLPKIEIPANVMEVSWVRQRENTPKGHDLVAEKPMFTKINPPEVLTVGHSDIDDSDQFRAMVLRTIHPF